jgi:hypothetical protein
MHCVLDADTAQKLLVVLVADTNFEASSKIQES